MKYPSPLRYPGGKNSITRFMKLLVTINGLCDGEYVEVYAGGASVGLSLLQDNYVSQIHLNDYNFQIYTFWDQVLNNTESLCQLITQKPCTVAQWHLQKVVYENPREHTPLDVAFATFFLNRTNFSGILNGRIIGGLGQEGKYPIHARYNREDLIRRIKSVASYKSRIHLYNMDAADFILNNVANMPRNTLVYLDPPYYVKGGDLYDHYYEHMHHVEVYQLIARYLRAKYWVVSYDNVPEIRSLYARYSRFEYNLSYSANEKTQGSELMFFNHRVRIPDASSPAYLSTQEYRRLITEHNRLGLEFG